MGNLWLGAFVGFIAIAILGWQLPVIGHLIGGLIAGLIAGGGAGRGALAGFLAGIFGGIVLTMLAVIGPWQLAESWVGFLVRYLECLLVWLWE